MLVNLISGSSGKKSIKVEKMRGARTILGAVVVCAILGWALQSVLGSRGDRTAAEVIRTEQDAIQTANAFFSALEIGFDRENATVRVTETSRTKSKLWSVFAPSGGFVIIDGRAGYVKQFQSGLSINSHELSGGEALLVKTLADARLRAESIANRLAATSYTFDSVKPYPSGGGNLETSSVWVVHFRDARVSTADTQTVNSLSLVIDRVSGDILELGRVDGWTYGPRTLTITETQAVKRARDVLRQHEPSLVTSGYPTILEQYLPANDALGATQSKQLTLQRTMRYGYAITFTKTTVFIDGQNGECLGGAKRK